MEIGGSMAWEYTVETIPLDHTGPTPNEILNTLGAEGWELVSVVSEPASGSIYVILFLKRQIATSRSIEGSREVDTHDNTEASALPRLMKRRQE